MYCMYISRVSFKIMMCVCVGGGGGGGRVIIKYNIGVGTCMYMWYPRHLYNTCLYSDDRGVCRYMYGVQGYICK